MLRKETVSKHTLELLSALMKDERLQDFFLVGGTALSLQIGHRISIDLDFFTTDAFNETELFTYLETGYGFRLDYQAKNTLKGQVSDVKVDFIAHRYPLIDPMIIDEDIRMANPADISAMKLNAISGNGTRLKDFIDIAYLSSSLTLTEMINAYSQKYSAQNPVMIIKALDYHDDINFNEPIKMINTLHSWKKVKGRLEEMIRDPRKLFTTI